MRLALALLMLAGCALAQQRYQQEYDYADYAEQPAPRAAPRAIGTSFTSTTVRPTVVPILKQINKHNDDGSYTYGFEAADGTFKIETKQADGSVKGKYGFVDDTGKVRTVEYGADRYGFQPSGEGITVAPPTLVDESQDYPEEPRPVIQATRPKKPKNRPPQQAYAPAPAAPIPQQPSYQQNINYPQPQQVSYAQPQQQQQQQQYQVVEQHEIPRSAAPTPPRRIQVAGAAPLPPRAQIPGAIPAGRLPVSDSPRAGPTPARRPQVPGAAPAPQQYYQPAPQTGPVQFQQAAPAPTPARRLQVAGAAPAPQPQQYFQPAPQVQTYQQQQAAPAPVKYQAPAPANYQPAAPARARALPATGSVLDQLAKDYALPQGGHALHDITFSGF